MNPIAVTIEKGQADGLPFLLAMSRFGMASF
jgi:hypothetical protein